MKDHTISVLAQIQCNDSECSEILAHIEEVGALILRYSKQHNISLQETVYLVLTKYKEIPTS